MTLFVAGVLIALGVSALCSVMEATLLSLTPAQVAVMSQRRPRLGRIWQGFKSDVERPIAVILLINTAAHTVGASVAGAQFGKVFGEEHLWLFAAVFTFLMLQFTEILAKSLGVRFNRDLAVIIGRPLQLSTIVLRPVLWFIHLINRPLEGRRADP
jgi:CBS domain containing-hemolysin-like protein